MPPAKEASIKRKAIQEWLSGVLDLKSLSITILAKVQLVVLLVNLR
jgi:hypothetical protein